ncbi:glycosyltransferase [Cystobacter fuscus]
MNLAVLLRRVMRALPRITRLEAPAPARWPRVSMIMPARDEARTLEPAMRSKLGNSYPELELVLVNDRSTDATGSLADRFAQEEPRLQVVHIEQLPADWVGKVHAMQRGLERASGEWILFSDADVHLAPKALERIVAYAEHEGLERIGRREAVLRGRAGAEGPRRAADCVLEWGSRRGQARTCRGQSQVLQNCAHPSGLLHDSINTLPRVLHPSLSA